MLSNISVLLHPTQKSKDRKMINKKEYFIITSIFFYANNKIFYELIVKHQMMSYA